MVNPLFLSHLAYLSPNTAYSRHFLQFRSNPQCPTIDEMLSVVDDTRSLQSPNLREGFRDLLEHRVAASYKLIKTNQIQVVDFWSPHYPRILRAIEDAPWCLFYLGHLPQPTTTLSIVGTRRPNRYGIEVLQKIITDLRGNSIQIVSGLAFGIDGAAHALACEFQIPNFAVLGSSVDNIYPKDHWGLAQRILQTRGGVLSEFPPFTDARPYHFPRRNRIISALAQLVWVVQGTQRSGSKHTVEHALRQAKMIGTTPGDIFSELSEVPHQLLQDGAHPITSAKDIESLLSLTKGGALPL